jgi:hypothetical protein
MAGSHSEVQCISPKQAADIAGKSESTMRARAEEHGWADELGAGHGPLAVSRWRCCSTGRKGR